MGTTALTAIAAVPAVRKPRRFSVMVVCFGQRTLAEPQPGLRPIAVRAVGNVQIIEGIAMDFERIDPMTNKPASKAQAMTAKEAAAVADRAAAGFEASSQLGPSARRATLAKAATSLEARKDQFVSLATGDPREGKTPLGAVVDVKTVHHVNSLIDDAAAKGASIVAGGKADSVLMPATVVDGVTSRMNIYHDESFGPVVGIIHAKDEADAIRLANDSAYGLSAAVFTRDTARGLRVARQIRSGICHVNGPTVHDEPQMPFGGVGASGYGRFGGKAGIDQFTELRWITVETQPGHFPI